MPGMFLFKCAPDILGKANSFPVFNFYAVSCDTNVLLPAVQRGRILPTPISAHRPTSSLASSTGAEDTALGNYLRKCCFFWEWSCPLGRQALFYSLSHNLSCFSGMRGRSVQATVACASSWGSTVEQIEPGLQPGCS